uniref:Coiled-coil domain containing 28A n=1 Tax=Hippocampus comes TaxID=109280 RepID=A0A3Q3D459_HIPCM
MEKKRLHSNARFSCWTPLNNRAENRQLFEERIKLVLHWFDLWTDRQRKHMLHSVLTRCTKAQLRYCRDLLTETLPTTQADFTAVLPRFLSLYIMSFLSPLDLCSAAQVSWHWRVLSEQDCLWAGRCIRQGWFLPYTPGEKEFGAWKKHFISCISTLDRLTPHEAAQHFWTLSQPYDWEQEEEEEEERLKERIIRQMIRTKIHEEKSDDRLVSTSASQCRGSGFDSGFGLPVWSLYVFLLPVWVFSGYSRFLPNSKNIPSSHPFSDPLSSHKGHGRGVGGCWSLSQHPANCLLLVSNKIPAYELVLSGAKADVIVVLYDHRGTLLALLSQVEEAVSGRTFKRLGLLAPGGTEEIHLFHNRTILIPAHRDFWEKLSILVAPAEQGGGIDIFSPCAASSVALMQKLAALTGLNVWAPMGLATGSFQNSESCSQSGCLTSSKLVGTWPFVNSDLSLALTEGLTVLSKQAEVNSTSCCSSYQEPLTAALNSNRAILSLADIFCLIFLLLADHREFKAALDARLQQWGAEQCVGDVCLKLCTHLRVYTNYLNNYTTALSAIDKCRDTKPAFRAFLKRTDRTLATHMLSLQELLLCPVWRIQEYTTLLQALALHTHVKWLTHCCHQLKTMKAICFVSFHLNEGNRQLIIRQDADLLHSPNDHIPESLRTYEHVADVSLFLFTDVLMLTRRQKKHTPFTVVHRSTHTFFASLALLLYISIDVKHAFILDGSSRSWVCATERGQEMDHFLCVLSSAMQTTLTST